MPAVAGHVRAEHVPQPLVLALPEQVQVEARRRVRGPPHVGHVGTGSCDEPVDARQRDRHQLGPVAELVAELVHRLVELEGGEQRGAAGRVDRQQRVDARRSAR